MNCTSIHECRSESLGMSLTYLPQFTFKNAEVGSKCYIGFAILWQSICLYWWKCLVVWNSFWIAIIL